MDKDTIHELSKLCRIRCTEAEEMAFEKEFSAILDYFTQLQELDTDTIEQLDHVIKDVHNVFRNDEIKPGLERKTFLDNAPSQIGGMIRVPLVIKQN